MFINSEFKLILFSTFTSCFVKLLLLYFSWFLALNLVLFSAASFFKMNETALLIENKFVYLKPLKPFRIKGFIWTYIYFKNFLKYLLFIINIYFYNISMSNIIEYIEKAPYKTDYYTRILDTNF